MRRTIERKFEGMSPLDRRKEVLRMQRIERAARGLVAGIDCHGIEREAHSVKRSGRSLPGQSVLGRCPDYGWISYAKLRDLADALGMYDDPKGPSKRSTD